MSVCPTCGRGRGLVEPPAPGWTTDADVVAAEAKLGVAQRKFDAARAEWEAAASRCLQAEQRTLLRPVAVSLDSSQPMSRETANEQRELSQLQEAEKAARQAMDHAGMDAVHAGEAARQAQLAAQRTG